MQTQVKAHKVKRLISFSLVVCLLSMLVTWIPQSASAYAQNLGNVISASVNGDFITIIIDNGAEPGDDILELQVCESDILRANYRPNGVASSPSTPIIDPGRTWSPVGAVINVTTNPMTINTPDMRIEIKKYPCRMTVKKADGTTLFWEPDNTGVFYEGVRFVRNSGHNMYGVHGYSANDGNGDILRNNATRAVRAGQQGDSGGPFMWSTAGYGLLVDSDGGYAVLEDSTNKMEFYYGNTTEEGRRYYKDNVEYYIMLGNPESIMENFAHITGESPLMPEWSLGFSNYEWGINQAEMYDMVETYRAKNIPIDSYGIDYEWKRYGQDNYGEFTWNTANFPEASTTLFRDNMLSLGMRLIGITKPRIVTQLSNNAWTQQGLDAQAGGYFYPGHNAYTDYFYPVTVQSIDPYKPEVRDWFWQHSIDAYNKGIVGWWNDETDKVASNGANYWFGNYTTLHLSQAMYEGQRSYTNDQVRVWQTGRNYYPGTQRYGTTMWSGDVGIQFEMGESVWWASGLDDQKATMLSSINNGQMKWGSDSGGFNSEGQVNPSPELYTRWLQLASFSSVFRVHGNYNHQRQPWYYGFTAEESSKAAIQLRYSLIPYMYSYEYKALEKGVGMVKPLMFDYPNDINVANYTDAWMFGDWLLVAPVTERYQTTKWIYLPAGQWIDYNTGLVYNGGQYIAYSIDNTTLTDIPTFIKAGAIIPTQKVLNYVDEEPVTEIFVDIFADNAASSFNFYDDDGNTYNYESGDYFKQVITAQDNGASGISVNFGNKTGTYSTSVQYYYAKIHGKAAQNVTVNGTAQPQRLDFNALKAAPGEGYAVGKDIYGDVTYVKVAAGTAKSIIATGSAPVAASGAYYEAEDASLWGSSIAGKAGSGNNHLGYAGWGFANNFEQSGAAVTFYANTKAGGDFPVEIRYANGDAASKKMSIYVNGSYAAQGTFASTADWSSWNTLTQTLPLTSGVNIITVQYDASNADTGYMNIDNIYVPYYPSVALYEAESAALHNGTSRATDHWFYSGSGFAEGLQAAGAEVEFRDIAVPGAGTYEVSLRYANGNNAARTLNVYVNGAFYTQASLPGLGSNWNTWGTWTQNMSLRQGQNTISFKFDSGNSGFVNIDSLEVKLISGAPRSEVNLLDNGGFERPTWHSSNWTEWHPGGQAIAYGVDQGIGSNPPEAAREGDKRAYFYSPGAYQQSIHQDVNVSNGVYRIEFWAKNYGAAPSIARAEIAVQGSAAQYVNISQSSEWRHYSLDNITANGSVDIGFYVNSPGGTIIHIDGVRLIKVS
ncbi:MAG: carbohydrate-binding protein [Oscillospiraceae bacterium]|nr:carbohydrate-binding protein [Oscillospiraceae bacterium]